MSPPRQIASPDDSAGRPEWRYIVHDYLQVNGGAERLVTTLARDLPRTKLVVSGIYSDFLQTADIEGVDVRVLARHVRWLPRIPRALAAFASGQARFLDAEGIVYSGVFAPLAVQSQKSGKRIYYCHTPPRFAFDRIEHYLVRAPFVLHRALRRAIAVYRRAYLDAVRAMDVVITNSEHVRTRLREQTGVRAEVVHPPIDTARFRWRGSGGYYLSLGRLEPNKRVDVVVKAFLQMPDKRLVVASGGSQRRDLERLAAGAPNISFTGWIDDARLAELIGNAVACIYVPRNEDFGMSAVEAMAAGKPVIGVDEGGMRETIVHGETGILAAADPRPSDIIRAVERLGDASTSAMRDACERRARDFSRERFVSAMAALLS
ncbi:glycosyltransferase [Xanthobacteraceae bacterium Astr-EGSB]|uniref:glycosyltransferase n=1 Tax=Astrobacterium formosum TaxID=3069710 RepID=UPI0027B192FE|nr:glycosyltransferase [Xanthobacteraceae bacterium Astr-EGSB]